MKKAFSLILAACLVLALIPAAPARAASGTAMTRGMFVEALGRWAGVDPETVPCVGVVTGDSVNVREAPGTDAKIALILMKGSAVSVLGLSDGWYRVRAGNIGGCIRADLLSARCAKFTDVDYGSDCGPYVQWAFALGLVRGVSDDRFDPDGAITQSQISAILSAYARATRRNLPDDLAQTLLDLT